MRLRQLGNTGLQVSELSMGGLFVASFINVQEQADAAVKRALELGVNYIDTAPGYGDSEAVLGHILPQIKTPYYLSTKFGGRPPPFDPRSPERLRQSFQDSLNALQRETIDIMFIHEPERPGESDWWLSWNELSGPVLDVLRELKQAGKIRYLGLAGTTVYEMERLIRADRQHDFDVLLTAFNYSLLWREAEIGLIPLAKERNMGIVIGSPLQQGALAKKYDLTHPVLSHPRRAQFERLYKLVDASGIALPELALRFVISNPAISTVLMGARSAQEVEFNVAAVEKGPLPADILHELDIIAAMVPFRPYCEPFGLGWILGSAPDSYRGPGRA